MPRLVTWVLVTTAIVGAIAVFVTFSENRERLAAGAREEARVTALALAHRLSGRLREVEQATGMLAAAVLHARPEPEATYAMLHALLASGPGRPGAAVAYEPGAYTAGGDLAVAMARDGDAWDGYDLAARHPGFREAAWYRIPALTGQASWIEPHSDGRPGGPRVASYAVPLFEEIDGRHRLVAVVRADLALDDVAAGIRDAAAALDPELGLLVLSREGRLIGASRLGPGLETTPPDLADMPFADRAATRGHEDLRELAERMSRGERGTLVLIGADRQTRRQVHFLPLEPSGWSLAVLVDESASLEPYRRQERRALLFLLLTLGLLAVVVVGLTRPTVGKTPAHRAEREKGPGANGP